MTILVGRSTSQKIAKRLKKQGQDEFLRSLIATANKGYLERGRGFVILLQHPKGIEIAYGTPLPSKNGEPLPGIFRLYNPITQFLLVKDWETTELNGIVLTGWEKAGLRWDDLFNSI